MNLPSKRPKALAAATLALLATGVAVYLARPSPPATPPVVEERIPAPARPLACAANVWSADVGRDSLQTKFADVAALGARGIRHATGGGAYDHPPRRSDITIADSLRTRGWTAILQVAATTTYELALDTLEVERIAERWGPFLYTYRDVYPWGMQVGNEINLEMRTAFRNGRDPLVPARRAAALLRSYARGVHRSCASCLVYSGGLGGVEIRAGDAPQALAYLTLLAPSVRSGLVANILDVHVYRAPSAFTTSTGEVRLREDYGATLTRLLSDAGWPAGTRHLAAEANVTIDEFRDPAAAAAALHALFTALYAVEGMEGVCIYSPWADRARYRVAPGSPVGEAFLQAATR